MQEQPDNLMTQAQYARHRGDSREAVRRAIKDKRITLEENGRINPLAADVEWQENTKARADGGKNLKVNQVNGAHEGEDTSEQKTADYKKSRARREQAEAGIAEAKLAELRGELVRKADIDRAAFEAARALRDGLTNCAKRLGATVAVLKTPEECAAAIDREHRTLLQSWAKTMGITPERAAQ